MQRANAATRKSIEKSFLAIESVLFDLLPITNNIELNKILDRIEMEGSKRKASS